MSQLISQLNVNSPDFKTNYEHNKQLAEQLAERQRETAVSRPQRTI